VRWDGRTVRVFNQHLQQIALHVQREPGRFSTQREHIVAEKISAVERGAAWLLAKVSHIGTQAARWSEAVIAARGVEGVRVLQGLLALAGKHPQRGAGKSLRQRSWLRFLPAEDHPHAPGTAGAASGAVRLHGRAPDHPQPVGLRRAGP
jgi:hypothetical protein